MRNRLFYIILCFCLITTAKGQLRNYAKISELNIGVGHMEYMNTVSVPSGLPGTSTHFEYTGGRINSNNPKREFDFFIRADYAYLMRKTIISDINIPYHHFELKFGTKWAWDIPVSIQNFRLSAGAGISFNALAGYNKKLNFSCEPHEIMYPYGNWYVCPDVHLGLNYKLNKISLQGGVSIPVFVVGFFQKYEYFEYYINDTSKFLKYVITPNSFAFPTNFLYLKSFISATYMFNKTKTTQYNMKISLNQEYLHSSINNNIEMKNNYGVSLALIILKK